MSHIVLCRNDHILFSTTLFSTNDVLCDCVIEQFMTPYGLVIPTGSNALEYVSRLTNPECAVHALPLSPQSPGMLLGEDGLVRTIHPYSPDNPDHTTNIAFKSLSSYPATGTWAVYDGDADHRNYPYAQHLQAVVMLANTTEEAFDILKTQDARFNDRGYQIYDVNTLIGWMRLWRASPVDARLCYVDYLVNSAPKNSNTDGDALAVLKRCADIPGAGDTEVPRRHCVVVSNASTSGPGVFIPPND